MPDRQLTEFGTEVPTLESALPDKLSETELYADISTGEMFILRFIGLNRSTNCGLMEKARIVGFTFQSVKRLIHQT